MMYFKTNMEGLKQYILSKAEERNNTFSALNKTNIAELTTEVYKANCITHGIQFVLDFLEQNNHSLDFLPDSLKEERKKYKNVTENTEEFQKIVNQLKNGK